MTHFTLVKRLAKLLSAQPWLCEAACRQERTSKDPAVEGMGWGDYLGIDRTWGKHTWGRAFLEV